jgi:L-ascorbate metabolism protein UlaG (beta-lactamase superfamily)
MLLVPAATARAAETAPKAAKIRVTWLGHATFEVVSAGGTRLLIDPFIAGNPATPPKMKDLSQYKPAAILVTHSHFDHSADALAVAKSSGARVIGAYDHIAALDLPEAQRGGGNVGGTFTVGDVTVHVVPAMHGSTPGGRPVGFVVRFADGRSLYHSGDTWIFGDMALIQEIFAPDVLLLQAGGGHYNQDPKVAALAVKKYFNPRVVIPMHYGTFPGLASEEEVRGAFKGSEYLLVMKPGETVEL